MLLENRAKMMFYFQVNGAIVNLLLNILLIPTSWYHRFCTCNIDLVLGGNHDSGCYCQTNAKGIGNAWQSNDLVSQASSGLAVRRSS